MRLYSKPGACSTACHITLRWSGLPFEVRVLTADDMKSEAYRRINPSGAVPALEDGGFVVTQNAAVLGYIADLAPDAGLAGDGSPRQRAEANRWLAFVNADLHPAFYPLFFPARFSADESHHEALREAARVRLRGMFEHADARLARTDWLAGFRSYADPYLYITLRWASKSGIDLPGLDALQSFMDRMAADPEVQAALRAEGLQ